MAAPKKYLKAKVGFTCNPGGEVRYVPQRGSIEHKGELVELQPTKEHAQRWPEFYVAVDAEQVIVATGDRYPADHQVVKGREVLFEDEA